MVKKIRTIAAGEFKAKCLALLDDVAITGEELVITKHGRPVAKVGPVEGEIHPTLLGSVLRERDIVSPVGEDWHADS